MTAALAAFVVVAHAFDLVTFLLCARVFPIEGELNPLARLAYIDGGDLGGLLFKAFFMAVFIGVVSLFPDPTHRIVAAWVFAIAGLLGAAVNSYSLLSAL
jgi:hypothetical protein